MSEAIKPTPGPWVAVGSGGPWEQRISIRAANWGTVAAVGVDPSLPHWDGPQRANARLIAEAGTVHHETGLTPRQLVEQRDALVERVKELEEVVADYLEAQDALDNNEYLGINAPPFDKVMRHRNAASADLRAALSKSLPNTVAEVK